MELNGERIDVQHALATILQKYQAGDDITLKIFRDGREFEAKAKLEERK